MGGAGVGGGPAPRRGLYVLRAPGRGYAPGDRVLWQRRPAAAIESGARRYRAVQPRVRGQIPRACRHRAGFGSDRAAASTRSCFCRRMGTANVQYVARRRYFDDHVRDNTRTGTKGSTDTLPMVGLGACRCAFGQSIIGCLQVRRQLAPPGAPRPAAILPAGRAAPLRRPGRPTCSRGGSGCRRSPTRRPRGRRR